MYNTKIAEEWGALVYPFIIEPTMKEVQLSKGLVSKRLQKVTGIKSKGTHFKMDVPTGGKMGFKEMHIIHAKDDNSMNDFTRRVQLTAIPVKNAKRKK
jgi:hypothetical protein